jgi:hypothetical protein
LNGPPVFPRRAIFFHLKPTRRFIEILAEQANRLSKPDKKLGESAFILDLLEMPYSAPGGIPVAEFGIASSCPGDDADVGLRKPGSQRTGGACGRAGFRSQRARSRRLAARRLARREEYARTWPDLISCALAVWPHQHPALCDILGATTGHSSALLRPASNSRTTLLRSAQSRATAIPTCSANGR